MHWQVWNTMNGGRVTVRFRNENFWNYFHLDCLKMSHLKCWLKFQMVCQVIFSPNLLKYYVWFKVIVGIPITLLVMLDTYYLLVYFYSRYTWFDPSYLTDSTFLLAAFNVYKRFEIRNTAYHIWIFWVLWWYKSATNICTCIMEVITYYIQILIF